MISSIYKEAASPIPSETHFWCTCRFKHHTQNAAATGLRRGSPAPTAKVQYRQRTAASQPQQQ